MQFNIKIFIKNAIYLPVVQQIKQGISPEKIALTVAIGAVVSIFPFLGASTFLCFIVAALLRLNQPIIQTVNLIFTPLHLVCLLPFYKASQIFGAPPLLLNSHEIRQKFAMGALKFFSDFAFNILGGILVWIFIAPILATILYWMAKPLIQILFKNEWKAENSNG